MSEDGTTGAAVGLRAPAAASSTRARGDRSLATDYRLLTTDYSRLTTDD